MIINGKKKLAVILVGKDLASLSFIKQKEKAAKFLGIDFLLFNPPENISTKNLYKKLIKFNKAKDIGGIIVQLPLPKHIDKNLILKNIDSHKDVDALSQAPKVLAPTVEAVKFIFQKYKLNFKKKKILIIGRGELVGAPLYNWLFKKVKNLEIIDEKQKNNLSQYTKKADIIISGVGKAKIINGTIIKKNAILIDFGFDKKNKKIFGDFDFESVKNKAKLITPVPGGMGPLTVAMLFKNFLKLNKK